jgi:hypothetical protein
MIANVTMAFRPLLLRDRDQPNSYQTEVCHVSRNGQWTSVSRSGND